MEYVEDEGRPRFFFQTRSSSAAASKDEDVSLIKVGKLHAAACFSTAAASILLLFFLPSLSQNQTLSFLLVWTSLSLLAAPFAPPPLTGGDARVGSGELLPPPPSPYPPLELDDPPKRIPGRRPRSQPSVPPPPIPPPSRSETSNGHHAAGNGIEGGPAKEEIVNEKEWGDEDFEILKKQISRHPAGEPRRWERIAEAFKGRHGIESVISMAKSMSERRPVSGDSFARFLKQRKPLDKRAEAEAEAVGGLEKRTDGDDDGSWSSGEDLALLNALKAFPKDASMRWEKIAAAIPGKSKACCMKRVAELKKGFRSSKASET